MLDKRRCGTLTMSWGFSFSSRGVFPGSAVMDSALSIVIVMMLAVTSCGGADSSAVRVRSTWVLPRKKRQVYQGVSPAAVLRVCTVVLWPS